MELTYKHTNFQTEACKKFALYPSFCRHVGCLVSELVIISIGLHLHPGVSCHLDLRDLLRDPEPSLRVVASQALFRVQKVGAEPDHGQTVFGLRKLIGCLPTENPKLEPRFSPKEKKNIRFSVFVCLVDDL